MNRRGAQPGNQNAKGNTPNSTSFKKGHQTWNKGLHVALKPRTGSVIICPSCNQEFYIRPSRVKPARTNYCSRGCANFGLYKTTSLTCKECGKEYRRPPSQVRWRGSSFCSRQCGGSNKSRNQKGVDNPSWRGGISKPNHRARQSKQFKDWRKAVFERDNYTCQICGNRGGYLEPDHIKPFAYFATLRFELSNGRTLCKPCHKKTDTYGVGAKRLYGMAKS